MEVRIESMICVWDDAIPTMFLEFVNLLTLTTSEGELRKSVKAFAEKHGLAFDKAYNGRFNNLFCKSGSILTKLKGNQLVIDKVNGKYFMYWGEHAIYAATSDNLIDWYPK